MTTSSPLPPILLLVDIQQGMVDGEPSWGSRSSPMLTENIPILLSQWRKKSWPIIHIQHDDIADPSNIINAAHPETYKIHACAAPLEDEPVFVKHVGSAFFAAGITEELERLSVSGKREIVLVGMDSSQCINNTARHGADLGWDITVVRDACAGYGMEGIDRDTVNAETTHRMAMAMLSAYGKVKMVAEVIEESKTFPA